MDAVSGACSIRMCALVPLKPNELTTARRGCADSHGRFTVLTTNGLLAKSMCRFGVEKFRLGGRVR